MNLRQNEVTTTSDVPIWFPPKRKRKRKKTDDNNESVFALMLVEYLNFEPVHALNFVIEYEVKVGKPLKKVTKKSVEQQLLAAMSYVLNIEKDPDKRKQKKANMEKSIVMLLREVPA